MKRTISVQHLERSGGLGYLVSTVTLEIPGVDGQSATVIFNDVTVSRSRS